MNKLRRKSLVDIMEKIQEISADLSAILEEEEECKDNIPENLQGSERYEISESACDSMESAIESLDEAVYTLEEII